MGIGPDMQAQKQAAPAVLAVGAGSLRYFTGRRSGDRYFLVRLPPAGFLTLSLKLNSSSGTQYSSLIMVTPLGSCMWNVSLPPTHGLV